MRLVSGHQDRLAGQGRHGELTGGLPGRPTLENPFLDPEIMESTDEFGMDLEEKGARQR